LRSTTRLLLLLLCPCFIFSINLSSTPATSPSRRRFHTVIRYCAIVRPERKHTGHRRCTAKPGRGVSRRDGSFALSDRPQARDSHTQHIHVTHRELTEPSIALFALGVLCATRSLTRVSTSYTVCTPFVPWCPGTNAEHMPRTCQLMSPHTQCCVTQHCTGHTCDMLYANHHFGTLAHLLDPNSSCTSIPCGWCQRWRECA